MNKSTKKIYIRYTITANNIRIAEKNSKSFLLLFQKYGKLFFHEKEQYFKYDGMYVFGFTIDSTRDQNRIFIDILNEYASHWTDIIRDEDGEILTVMWDRSAKESEKNQLLNDSEVDWCILQYDEE